MPKFQELFAPLVSTQELTPPHQLLQSSRKHSVNWYMLMYTVGLNHALCGMLSSMPLATSRGSMSAHVQLQLTASERSQLYSLQAITPVHTVCMVPKGVYSS
jgi:hypothetical protein